MPDIDYMMNLLDWNKSSIEQAEGIRLARSVENIQVFFQPCTKHFNKNVWDNCAKVLSARSDEELSPYWGQMLAWLQDLNWPGAYCILDRIKRISDKTVFNVTYAICMKCANAMEDTTWAENLKMIEN